MAYLKSFMFGLGGAVLASVLWLIVTLILPMFLPFLFARITGAGGGSFGSVGSGSILLAALIGFVLAFGWTWHRLRIV